MHLGHYGAASMRPSGYGYPPSGYISVHRPSIASHPMMQVLDDSARQALEAAGYETASAILVELQSKGQEIRNPSAYVLKSATNARKGIGAAAAAGPTAGYSYAPPMPLVYAPPPPRSYAPPALPQPPRNGAAQHRLTDSILDERAQAALSELPPDAAEEVWRQFESVQSTVRKPSAYVMRAVENYWKAGGQGKSSLEPPPANSLGGVAPPTNVAANRELIAPWLDRLDETAVAALESADTQVVASCLAELEAKLESVRNPSAYVVRSISNANRARQTAPERAALEEELSMLPVPLDTKATAALEEVGPAAALAIVQHLQQNFGSIGNPSAYVTKSVHNHKQSGMLPLGARPLKKLRVD